VPLDNIIRVFNNRLPHIDHMKHCILSKKQLTSVKSGTVLYHSLNEFYTFLISISRDVVTEDFPDWIKLDITLKQLK